MALIVVIIFWASLFILFYTYIGYGILIYFINRFRTQSKPSFQESFPSITIVVPCYNEETIVEEKILNSLSLDYPSDQLKILFITDGSTDRTTEIISKYQQVILLHEDKRAGKSAAENRAMQFVDTDITLFCDANAMFNSGALKAIVSCFADDRVGGVSGEKRLQVEQNDGAMRSEGIYWKYESFLKQQDAIFYTVVGAAGELFAIRTALYVPMAPDTINDDLTQSLSIVLNGHRIAYSSAAYAMERPSENLIEEKKRKIRMIAGAWQTMVRMPAVFNPFRNFRLSFQFISHRALRWTLCPLALLTLFISNALLCVRPSNDLYFVILIMQCLFYVAALIGFLKRDNPATSRLFNFTYYFIFMNYCSYLGFFRFISGNQSSAWDRSKRKV